MKVMPISFTEIGRKRDKERHIVIDRETERDKERDIQRDREREDRQTDRQAGRDTIQNKNVPLC